MMFNTESRARRRCAQAFCSVVFAVALPVSAQVQPDSAAPRDSAKKLPQVARLFRVDSVIPFTLTANFRALGRDRNRASAVRPGKITFQDSAGPKTIPVRVRSRGHWRLKNCDLPPVRLSFTKDSVRGTPFAGLDHSRLIMHCRNSDSYEQYILPEYQLYRIFNVLTPLSQRARLARVTYVDSANAKLLTTRYAFLLEDENAMAARNGGTIMVAKGAKAGDMNEYHDALIGVFQYMIGNTDWSVAGLHNVFLVDRGDSGVYATVYDLDFSGAVDAPYAIPDPRLPIKDVVTRLMRGYCAPPDEFGRVFALFREKKAEIYALYADPIGQLMDRGKRERALAYFDDFYSTINDPRAANDRIVKRCLPGQ